MNWVLTQDLESYCHENTYPGSIMVIFNIIFLKMGTKQTLLFIDFDAISLETDPLSSDISFSKTFFFIL